MSSTKLPENVIPVNFKKKNKIPTMEELYPDAFAMCVDTTSKNPDEFSQYVMKYLKEEKETALKSDQDD